MQPGPLLLAREIAPLLTRLDWGIGGSTLLFKLGLIDSPRDLDLVVMPRHFESARSRLSSLLTLRPTAPHPTYVSKHFARFISATDVGVDIMASIAVRSESTLTTWDFDPRTLSHDDGLPWMRAEDWVCLYRLFGRHERAQQLADYLAKTGIRSGSS